MQTQTKQIAFTQDNVAKCQCTTCPVQAGSACVADKMRSSDATPDISVPRNVPKVYCSQGTSDCGDLDFSPNCICPTCSVWQENGLDNYKYCRDGDATRIG